MAKQKTKKLPSTPLLRKVGLWATIWWGVSCAYILLVVWQAKNLYVGIHDTTDLSRFGIWGEAIKQSFSVYSYLWPLLGLLLLVWVVGAYVWLKALKQAHISYKAGLKDLFLTIR